MPLEASNKRNIVSFYGRSGKSFLKCTFAQGRNVKSFLKCTFAQGRNGKSNLKSGFSPGTKWQIILNCTSAQGRNGKSNLKNGFSPGKKHCLNCILPNHWLVDINLVAGGAILNLVFEVLPLILWLPNLLFHVLYSTFRCIML